MNSIQVSQEANLSPSEPPLNTKWKGAKTDYHYHSSAGGSVSRWSIYKILTAYCFGTSHMRNSVLCIKRFLLDH